MVRKRGCSIKRKLCLSSHFHQQPGGVHLPLLERCSVAAVWAGSLCKLHDTARKGKQNRQDLTSYEEQIQNSIPEDMRRWAWVQEPAGTPPACVGGKSTRQTVWRWGWWRTGRHNARYQEEEWWSPPTPRHALKGMRISRTRILSEKRVSFFFI